MDSKQSTGPADAPAVSIITPFWNAARFLAETIQSVVAQTFQDWEYLLIDDGSTDGGLDIAREFVQLYPGRIHLLRHDGGRNLGTCASRNVGLNRSKGRYLAFLDADDVWLRNKLADQVGILDRNPSAAMVYGASLYWHAWTGLQEDRLADYVCELGVEAERIYAPPLLCCRMIAQENVSPCPSDILVRRETVFAAGGFEAEFTRHLQLYEDQAFLAKIYLRDGIYVSSQSWTLYRIHPDSCDSWVVRSGRHEEARSYFLSWMGKYLNQLPEEHLEVRNVLSLEVEKVLTRSSDEAPEPIRDVYRCGWWLRWGCSSKAELSFPGTDADWVRVEIPEIGSQSGWDVQLNKVQVAIRPARRYRIRFEARSDASRSCSVGLAQCFPPWENLGFYEDIRLTPQWTLIDYECTPSGCAANARVCLDLGGCDVAVEVRNLILAEIPENGSESPEAML